jgi:gluconate kinase
VTSVPRLSARARGYDSRWDKARITFLKSRPFCAICAKIGRQTRATVVDHIKPHKGNQALFWDSKNNWQPACKPCHDRKTAVENGGFGHVQRPDLRGCTVDGLPTDPRHSWNRGSQLSPFLVLCGMAGVGKTTIRRYLAKELGAVSLGVDDFTDRWIGLYPKLDTATLAVVECCMLPNALVDRGEHRGAFIVHVTVPAEVRHQRLVARGEAEEVIRSRMSELGQLGYERSVAVDLVIEAQGQPEDTPRTIAQHYRSAVRRKPSARKMSKWNPAKCP